MRVLAGVAVVDVTPPAGLAMAGFAARTEPATGAHDALTVRALVIDDTALVVADCIGIEAGMSARIRAQAPVSADRVVVAATHTHGGPFSMGTRVRGRTDPAWVARLEAACVAALAEAAASRAPARLWLGAGTDTGLARNRRTPGGPVDRSLPRLEIRGEDGACRAILMSWACHPVVLNAANRLWTADYVHFLRARAEALTPGAVALFVTGCCGDVNTGHSAHASISLDAPPERSFAEARRLGETIAEAALAATVQPVAPGPVTAAERHLTLALRGPEPVTALAERWRRQREAADAATRALLDIWLGWAATTALRPPEPVPARVCALRWGGAGLLSLPGEIFAADALALRNETGPAAFVASYAEDNPGYICPAPAFAVGGYEVLEAHRYYDQPAGFAAGAAEALSGAALAAWRAAAPTA